MCVYVSMYERERESALHTHSVTLRVKYDVGERTRL